MVRVEDIMIWRDGGTITFRLEGDGLSGKYRLRTPFAGEPRPMFRDDVELPLGGKEEAALLEVLRGWFSPTEVDAEALARLDALHEWRDLPDDLVRVTPLHRMRTVIRCLEGRRHRPT